MTSPSVNDLLAAACHFGHPKAKWNPKMATYIYGIHKGIHIFDLEQTQAHLESVCSILSKMQSEGKTVLFVSTKQQSIPYIEAFNESLNQPIVTKKWIPGLMTNWQTIKQRLKHYLDLKNSFSTGDIEKYTKKEQTHLRKQLMKLDAALGGVSDMTERPHALFVVDAVRDRVAVLEAKKLHIPVYGICDSNADPEDFTECIPANDDAVNSIDMILTTVLEAMGGKPKEKKAPQAQSD